jgi:hypothetical protein
MREMAYDLDLLISKMLDTQARKALPGLGE